MDDDRYHGEDSDPDAIRAEIVDEFEPGTPWQWEERPPEPQPPRRRVRLPVLLFVATGLSTLLAGTLWSSSWDQGWFPALLDGLRYSIPVMTILLCHEMGHFLQALRYGVPASLPYFIPMPFTPLGTMGAVIAMQRGMGHRKALFDIGISGPLAGLAPTIIFLVIGLRYSTYGPPPEHGMFYGDPPLFKFLASTILHVPPGYEVLPHPMAFAGWVGLLITSLNLIPIGQLDGGHILYALLREKANRIASLLLLFAAIAIALDLRNLGNWIPMLILVYFLIGTAHPPTADDNEPLGPVRIVLGWLALAFIVIGFTPTPIRMQ